MEKKIQEIHSITEILNHLEKGSHVFFDLDYTVLTSTHDFGSIAWETYVTKSLIQDGVPELEAIDRASDFWKSVQFINQVKLIEDKLPEVIQQLKDAGHPVLAITARSPELRKITENQLTSLNLTFEQMFFCGKIEKGQVLKSYTDECHCPHIVMIDDTLHHLKTALEHLTIPFTGLRYGHLDAHKENYKPDPVTALLTRIFNNADSSGFLKNALPK